MTCFPQMTWEYIDSNMTLPRLTAMNRYWESNPPLHQVVAAFVGVKPPSDEKINQQEADLGIDDFMRVMNGG